MTFNACCFKIIVQTWRSQEERRFQQLLEWLWLFWLGHGNRYLASEKPVPILVLCCGPSTAWTDLRNEGWITHTYKTILRPFFRDHPGELVPEENVWTLLVQGKISRGRHTDHPAGRHSIRTKQCPPPPSPHFLQARCPSCCTTNSVKALKATGALGLGRRR